MMRGDLAAAEAETLEVRELADEAGDGNLSIAARRLLGETLLEAGRLDAAEDAFADALERSVRLGDRWSRTELHAYRAQIAAARGDLPRAEALLAEARFTLRETDVAAQSV
jgi:ATP/maltotriose-dependent transcriptional regulator MalT